MLISNIYTNNISIYTKKFYSNLTDFPTHFKLYIKNFLIDSLLKIQAEITDEHRFWQKLLLFPQGA